MASRNVHGLRLNDSAKASLCTLEDNFSAAEDEAKDALTSAQTDLRFINNQVDDLDIPARKLLGETPEEFFGLPEPTADFEAELEQYRIFIVDGIPLIEGSENNLSSMRSLAKITSFSALENFVAEDPGSFTYIAFSGFTNLGQDVNLGGTASSNYIDFFWLEFANSNFTTIAQLEGKGFSERQISNAVAGTISLPTATTGSGENNMNVTFIQDANLLDELESLGGLSSSAVGTLITDRTMISVDLSQSSTDALQEIQGILLTSVGVSENSQSTLYFTPELMVLGSLDPKQFTPEEEAQAIADELSTTSLTEKEESDTALILGTVETAWDSIGRILKEYRNRVSDELNETSIFLSWYLNTVGFGTYNNSPLPATLGSAATSAITDANINELLLEDARDDCKIDALGVEFDDALRKASRGLEVSKKILRETSIILDNAPDTLRPEVVDFANRWKGNFDLILFLLDSVLGSIGQMRLSVMSVFPRLFDDFTDSRAAATSTGTSGILDSLG